MHQWVFVNTEHTDEHKIASCTSASGLIKRRLLKIATCIVCCVMSLPVVIPNSYAQTRDTDFDVQKLELNWTPGERYNGLKGVMNYAHTDLYLPGNGNLPIEVQRIFRQIPKGNGYSPSGQFGMMQLNAPTVRYSYSTNGDSTRDGPVCISSSRGVRTESTNRLSKPITFTHGEKQVIFYGGGGNTGVFYSPDGWVANCLASDSTVNFGGNMLVRSPDGMRYYMTNIDARNIGSGGRFTASHELYVTQVYDQYDNKLTYNYQNQATPRFNRRLDSIVASDGRVVTFRYIQRRVTNSRNETNVIDYIDTITTNSRSNPITLKYSYSGETEMSVTENGTAKTTVNFSVGRISRITYPTGGKVTYEYSGTGKTAGVDYRLLRTRKTSDGSRFTFVHNDNGDRTFTRTITTLNKKVAYRYGNAAKLPSLNYRPQSYSIDSGRLKEVKWYDRRVISTVVIDSEFEAHPSVLIEYTDEKIRSTSGLARQASDLVRPKSVKVKVISRITGNALSVFTTNYYDYDRHGYAQRITEGSPTGSYRSTTYTYQHQGFRALIRGKLKTAQGNGNKQKFDYNDKGDVVSSTINGVTTTYDWYEDGENKGEMKWSSRGSGKRTNYDEYKRGIAQFEKNPSGYGKIRKVNDNGTIAFETDYTRGLNFDLNHRPVIQYQYDSRRRLLLVDPARRQTAKTSHHWPNNNKLEISDENNRRFVQHEHLDGFGRIIARGTYDRDQNLWSTIEYEYDPEGRLVYESFPKNETIAAVLDDNSRFGTQYAYDAVDRIRHVTWQTERTRLDTWYSYDTDSDRNPRITITDNNGRREHTDYLAYGTLHYEWPISIKESDGTKTTIERDGYTHRIKKITRGGRVTDYDYNSKGQLDYVKQRENGVTSYTYHSDGLLETATNGECKVTYTYYRDGSLRMEHFFCPDKYAIDRSFRYDYNMNLSNIFSSRSGRVVNEIAFEYDEDKNVTKQISKNGSVEYTMSYEYDELSSLSEITYPNGRVYAFEPNSFGDPTLIKELGGTRKTLYNKIKYNPNNSMSEMSRNGSHQIKNNLTTALLPRKFRITQYGNNRTKALGERIYEYDPANNVTKIIDTVNDFTGVFDYDRNNRMTIANFSNAPTYEYKYLPTDDIDWVKIDGRRSDYKYDSSTKRLKEIDPRAAGRVSRKFAYDRHGNMTLHQRLISESRKVTNQLTFNAANQVVEMSDGTKFEYDGRGLRIEKESRGSILYVYDKNEKLIYRDDMGAGVTSEYFYVSGKMVARRDTDVGNSSEQEPENSSEQELGKPRTLWPAGGNVDQRPGYKWSSVSGATKYDVDVRKGDRKIFYKSYKSAEAGCSGNSGDCVVATPHDTALSGEYRWKVKAKTGSASGAWSEWRIFNVRN